MPAKLKIGLMVAVLSFLPACFDKAPVIISYEINLYSGIRGLANLGDSWSQIRRAAKYPTEHLDLPSGSDSDEIKFNAAYAIPAMGTRLYFREGHLALVEIQEPFKGVIQGKRFKLFEFRPPTGRTWEDALILQFGSPMARSGGGRLGSEAVFYAWGDFSYNRMGTNEIAIYRDPSISSFRQRHFGRNVGSIFVK